MEPLVVASAVVVLVCGYRTVMEVIGDMESEGSWSSIKELLRGTAVRMQHALRVAPVRCRRTCYNDFLLAPKARRPRNILLKPHA